MNDEPALVQAPADHLHELFGAAEKMHELFEAFMVGGFSEEQALKLVANMMVAQSTQGSSE